MKRCFCMLIFSCVFVYAMEQSAGLRVPHIIKAALGLILNKTAPLCDADMYKVQELIKEMRVQSPALALAYEQKLADRLTHDSIKTDGKFEEDAHLIKCRVHVRRPSSPLMLECR